MRGADRRNRAKRHVADGEHALLELRVRNVDAVIARPEPGDLLHDRTDHGIAAGRVDGKSQAERQHRVRQQVCVRVCATRGGDGLHIAPQSKIVPQGGDDCGVG